MKKLLIIALLGIIFTSCIESNIDNDPKLKESERIAVLQTAKTDTLNIAVHMDDKLYILKDKEVKQMIKDTREDLSGGFVIVLVLFFLSILGHAIRD